MNITIPAPPEITGNNTEDLKALSTWCTKLFMQLKRIIYTIDDTNIASVDASKVSGTLSLLDTAVQGTNIKIGEGEFLVSTADGKEYLKLDGEGLSFCGTVVSA